MDYNAQFLIGVAVNPTKALTLRITVSLSKQ
jgi:hypothetical protein